MKAYIYKIENLINKKTYIGFTSTRPSKRKWKHFDELKKGIHYNGKIQKDFNKYGADNFMFEILEEINEREKYSERENFWINKYNSISNGYNIISGGSGIVSDKTKSKMSESHKGKVSHRRVINDYDAINIYSIFYFYGKLIRPMSKITKYSRDSIKELIKGYNNITNLFDSFSLETKFSIFKTADSIYNIDLKKLTYLPDNIYYLIHFYNDENVYTKNELKDMFGKSDVKSINNILSGKVKPDIHNMYIHGNIDEKTLSELSILAKYIGNPVPSLERNFFKGATTRENELSQK